MRAREDMIGERQGISGPALSSPKRASAASILAGNRATYGKPPSCLPASQLEVEDKVDFMKTSSAFAIFLGFLKQH
jgi:hypothetical protein